MLQIGDIRVHLIQESHYLVDPGGPFGLVPRALWSRHMTPTEDLLVPMTSNCLLLQSAGRNIVVDTGYGHKLPAKVQRQIHLTRPHGDLCQGLASLGLAPADVDLVINTHLHADHCAGNTCHDENGDLAAVFPNAEYVVQRREYEDACRPNERTRATYLAENFEPLRASGQLRLLDGDCELALGLRGVVTPGHTPGHMSIVLESEGQCGVQLADMATYALHFERLGWMTAYDVEPLITLETKRRWQAWALEREALLFFPHDPQRPAGQLRRDESGRLKVEPVEFQPVQGGG
ncbi:MAG: MBL fold metallo-hydrolase [Anaerolineaceae bacterium]|nr:MBL fold metallo-hydrolase [Anaerolineaceae bacterium]